MIYSSLVCSPPLHYWVKSFHLFNADNVPLSIFSLSGLYRLAGVCANLYGTAVHQSWVVMATPGQKFCAVTSILQTISCVSPLSPTALFPQGGVEVRSWLHRHICLSWPHSTNNSISGLTISVPQASCRDCELEEASSSKDTLETFCRSDFGEYQYCLISSLLCFPSILDN